MTRRASSETGCSAARRQDECLILLPYIVNLDRHQNGSRRNRMGYPRGVRLPASAEGWGGEEMRRVVAIGLLLAVAGLAAGCGSSGSPSTSGTHSPSAAVPAAGSPSAAPAPQVTDSQGVTCDSLDSAGWCPGDDPTTCDTTLDPTGWNNGPLTEVRAIAIVAAVMDTDFTGVIEGTLSDTEMHLLNQVFSATFTRAACARIAPGQARRVRWGLSRWGWR
jgi:hypothetical protein